MPDALPRLQKPMAKFGGVFMATDLFSMRGKSVIFTGGCGKLPLDTDLNTDTRPARSCAGLCDAGFS